MPRRSSSAARPAFDDAFLRPLPHVRFKTGEYGTRHQPDAYQLSAKSDFHTEFVSRDLITVIAIGLCGFIRDIRSIVI